MIGLRIRCLNRLSPLSGAMFALITDMFLLTGHGHIYRGNNDLGEVDYTVHTEPDGQGTLVELHPAAPAEDGAILHLVLQDGRYVVCQNIDSSKYCAVVGDGPNPERRKKSHEAAPRQTVRESGTTRAQ